MARWAIERLLGVMLPILYRIRLAGWYVRRPLMVGVRVLVIDGDQILLVRGHGQNQWHLPGGAVERNETLAEAAQREVREEAGCNVEIERLLGMYSNFGEYKSDHVAIFVGHPLSPPALRLNIEIADARYFPLAALPRVHRSVTDRLADYTAQTWGMHGPWDTRRGR